MAYLTVKSVQQVKNIIDEIKIDLKVEEVLISDCVGRTLAEDIFAPLSLPPCNRSAVDGYCVKWQDVSGASETLPIFLEILDNIEMGQAPVKELNLNTAMVVATGSMLPKGADSVVMLEYTEQLSNHEVAIYAEVGNFENVLKEGEDVKKGDKILSAYTQISPENISLLAALGIDKVKVFKKCVVGIISTGDELVEIGEELKPGQIYNSNGPGLITAVKELGSEPLYFGIIKDDLDALKGTLVKAIKTCDMVVLTGGTSAGAKDYVADAIDNTGEPGVLVHGIAIKPGKPTIVGAIGSVPVFGLSGNPVSAMLSFRLFIQGLISNVKPSFIKGKVKRNIPSAGGREDYIPVIIEKNGKDFILHPIFTKSNSIGSLSKMDGLLIIDKDIEGLREGDTGTVMIKEGYDYGLLK